MLRKNLPWRLLLLALFFRVFCLGLKPSELVISGNERAFWTLPSAETFPEAESVVAHFAPFCRRVECLSVDPLVVVLHDFVQNSDCDALIAAADRLGFDESTVRAGQEEGAEIRTSSTSWLNPLNELLSPEEVSILRSLDDKVADFSQVPVSNLESLQCVRYEPGQRYKYHLDTIEDYNDFPCGGRLLSCLIYLNGHEDVLSEAACSLPESTPSSSASSSSSLPLPQASSTFSGGETHFLETDISVVPRKGAALVWLNCHLPLVAAPPPPPPPPPSYEDGGTEEGGVDPCQVAATALTASPHKMVPDLKSTHAGLPVTRGVKYAANKWVHAARFRPAGD